MLLDYKNLMGDNKIIEYAKANFWSDDENTQRTVFDFFANVVARHISAMQPKNLTESTLISNAYDSIWRTLATEYYNAFKKPVLDWDFYKTMITPVLTEYYKEDAKE